MEYENVCYALCKLFILYVIVIYKATRTNAALAFMLSIECKTVSMKTYRRHTTIIIIMLQSLYLA